MATQSVQALVDDIRLLGEEQYTLVQRVRTLTKQTLDSVDEQVKYGGILFASAGILFGGVFAYRQHVSVEFGHGAAIKDPFGHLEGTGKGRRHLKLKSEADIATKHLAEYLKLAFQAAKGEQK